MIPSPAHPISRSFLVDPRWYDYFRKLGTSALTEADVQAIVDAAVEAIPGADVSILQTSSIQVTGNAQNGYAISLRPLADSGSGALLGVTRDIFGRISGTTDATITGTAGEVDVANGDAVAGPPTLSLADVADSGTGTLQKTAFDAKGRKTGTAAATTDDLGEGATNLYYTNARADARVVYGLQQNTSATYTDSYGVVNTLSIARASDWDDGGLRKVSGGITARARFSSTEEYDAEFTGIGLSTYLYNPSQAGSAYTTTGIQLVGDEFSFNSLSIDKATKGFLGSRYITLRPESINDPSSGGFDQKIVKVQNKAGTLALTSDIVRPVPLSIAAGETYIVPANTQVLWTIPIELEAGATIEVLGDLVEVN